jgi:hypothetical protein
MAEQSSEGRHGVSPDGTAARRFGRDWLVYVAFLPGVVIGIAAAIDFGTPTRALKLDRHPRVPNQSPATLMITLRASQDVELPECPIDRDAA